MAAGVASALVDLDEVFEFVGRQSYIDTDHMLIAGISRGGYLSVVSMYCGEGEVLANT